MEVKDNQSSASRCADFLSAISKAPVSISQSGKTLVIGLNNGKTATGTLDGKTVKAQFTGTDKSGVAECGDGLTLTATLEPLAQPRALSGMFSIDGCGSCAPVEFHAVRQQPKSAGGMH
jgi:hypothetical protein